MVKEEEDTMFEELLEQLKEEDSTQSEYAQRRKIRTIKALGELGDKRAVNPLIQSLENEDGSIRNAVLYALGKLKDPKAVQPLLKILVEEEEIKTRKVVAEVLGILQDKRAVDPLIAIFQDNNENVNVRAQAAYALGKIGGTKAKKSLLEKLSVDSTDSFFVARALGGLNDFEVFVLLFDVLSDAIAQHKTSLRDELKGVLRQFKDEKIIDTLLPIVENQDDNRRGIAIELLGKSKNTLAFEPLLKVAKSKNDFHREGAIWALEDLGDLRVVEFLKEALRDSSTRGQALKVLYNLDRASAFEPLIKALHDKSDYLRNYAAKTLGELEDKRAVEPLIELLKDKEEWVRKQAVESLGKLGDSRALEPLKQALTHEEDSKTKASIKTVLKKLGYLPLKKTTNFKELLQHFNDKQLLEFYINDYSKNVQEWMNPILEKVEAEDAYESFDELLKSMMYGAIARLSKLEYSNLLIKVFNVNNDDWSVKSDIVEALGNIGDPTNLDFLGNVLGAFKHYYDSSICYDAAKALGKIGGRKAIRMLIETLTDIFRYGQEFVLGLNHCELQMAIAEALGDLEDERALSVLNRLVQQSEVDWVTKAAEEAVQKIEVSNQKGL